MAAFGPFVMPVNTAPRSTSEAVDKLGSIRMDADGKWYKCVKLDDDATDNTVDAAAGDVCVYTDYSAHEVGVDVTDMEADLAAGIALSTWDMSADGGKYVWIQIKGHYEGLNTDAAGSAGQVHTGSGMSDKALAAVNADTEPPVGVLIDATASSQDFLCDFPF